MAIRNIVKEGEPVLRKVCRPVEKFDERLAQNLDDMIETMKSADGVGLAAPQIGILRRYAVVEMEDRVVEIINPEIVEKIGEQREPEGCLSCPNKWGVTVRPKKVKVKAQDRNGKVFYVEGVDLSARALCHEIDHLDGTLFIDKVIRFLTPEEIEG